MITATEARELSHSLALETHLLQIDVAIRARAPRHKQIDISSIMGVKKLFCSNNEEHFRNKLTDIGADIRQALVDNGFDV